MNSMKIVCLPLSEKLRFCLEMNEKCTFFMVLKCIYICSYTVYMCTKHHSCETALLEVANAILTNMDNQKVTLLTLLDLSVAFDTVPHSQFLERLES